MVNHRLPIHSPLAPPSYFVLQTAAAAASLQSCRTLCDHIDGSPPGSPVPGILQARTLEWVAISFSKTRGPQRVLWMTIQIQHRMPPNHEGDRSLACEPCHMWRACGVWPRKRSTQPAPDQPTRAPTWAVLPAPACFTQITSSFVLAKLFIASSVLKQMCPL